ncbi:MAG TPA: efflux RND transporter periplasmic adaptor subunit, partial [Bacillota bacterium]|nr:efflux RND transporter periplasmic adaptor subunit [Bacillota bacterium]
MIKKYKTLILLSVVTISLLGCGKKDATTQAETNESLTPVQIAKVVEGDIDQKAGVTGKLQPKNTVLVSPKVSARIAQINVELGTQVKEGDVLFTLDSTDLANTLAQEQAALEMAQANLKQAQTNQVNGKEQAENSVLTAKNTLDQTNQALQDAQTNEQRVKQLFTAGASSTADLEKAQTNLKNAETAYKNAQVSLDQSNQSLSHARQQDSIEVAQASVKQASVRVQNAKDQLANATVTSPISGVVSMVNGAAGQMAGAQTTVVTIVQVDPILVKAYLSEQERIGVNVGTKAEIEISSLNKKLEAVVSAVSPVIDSQLKAYPVEISISNPSAELQSDLVANVKFENQNSPTVKSLVIPYTAIVEEQGKKYVYQLNDSVVKKVEITTDVETSEQATVKSGLTVGDEIVVRGQSLLTDGAKVQVQKT